MSPTLSWKLDISWTSLYSSFHPQNLECYVAAMDNCCSLDVKSWRGCSVPSTIRVSVPATNDHVVAHCPDVRDRAANDEGPQCASAEAFRTVFHSFSKHRAGNGTGPRRASI